MGIHMPEKSSLYWNEALVFINVVGADILFQNVQNVMSNWEY